jgi:hypothetical protein
MLLIIKKMGRCWILRYENKIISVKSETIIATLLKILCGYTRVERDVLVIATGRRPLLGFAR